MEVKSKESQVVQTAFKLSGLKNKSTFNRKPYSHKYINVFKNMVQEDIKKMESNKKKKTKLVWEAIK